MTFRTYHAVASFVPYDAVSEAARRFIDLSDAGGSGPRVIAEGIDASLTGEAIPYRDMPPGRKEDAIIYHLSTDSVLAEWLSGRPERIFVYYHNLTPAAYLAEFDPQAATRLERARREAAELARIAEGAAAPSEYSLGELRSWDYANTMKISYPVRPLPQPSGRHHGKRFDEALRHSPSALFVGRLTPNKCQHDLLRVGAALEAICGGGVVLAGGTHLPLYERYLRELSGILGTGDRPFAGRVTPSELYFLYHNADVFLSLSTHEGFCVPIVEAFAAGLPVIALDRAAVAETVGGAGLLIDSARPAFVAELVRTVCENGALRRDLVADGLERARELCDPAPVREGLDRLVTG